MIWQVIIAGMGLGLLSSLHCVGMCGPLALALPVHHLGRSSRLGALFLYNAGRIMMYSFLGLLFGLAGRRLYIAGWQQAFSIALGIGMLLVAFQYIIKRNPVQPRWMQAFYFKIQVLMGRFLRSGKKSGFLLLGLANGLLPCGMVYIAIAGALSTARVDQGALFMFFYGIGTFPAMMLLGLFGRRLDISIRKQFKKWLPALLTGMAILLILRGLNLGIPFLSPVLGSVPPNGVSCH